MMNTIAKLVASAAFVVATLAGTQSASAQQVCSFEQLFSGEEIRCGFLGRLGAQLDIGLLDATVSTTVPPLRQIPHEIHIEITCNTGTANNGTHFAENDSFSRAECPNGGYVNRVDAWVVVDPEGTGQGVGEGEGEEGEGEGEEGGDDAGSDEEDQGGEEESGE